jgi:hypothetical protein
MDVERITRAIREGPPDEPSYVPGAFQRSQGTSWGLALATASVCVALVAGIIIGTGLGVLRGGPSDRVGAPSASPRLLTPEDLQGTWTSGELDRDAWADTLLERGFTQDDLDAFLAHEPWEATVRYFLVFRGGQLRIGAIYDDGSPQTLSDGRFVILGDGTMQYSEAVDGLDPGAWCVVSVAPSLQGDLLSFRIVDVPCDTDAQMANITFFELATYTNRAR